MKSTSCRNEIIMPLLIYNIINYQDIYTFIDQNPNNIAESCEIKIKTGNVGIIFETIQRHLVEYINETCI